MMTFDNVLDRRVCVKVTGKVIGSRTFYQIDVVTDERSTTANRRYSECLSVLEKVKKQLPVGSDAIRLKLPSKKLFKKVDADVIQIRCRAIEEFVRTLVCHHALRKNSIITKFLNLDSSRQNSVTEESADEYSMSSRNSSACSSGRSSPLLLGPSEKKAIQPGDFEFLKVIGKGSFGKVLLARHREESNLYAVKVLDKTYIINKNEVEHVMVERNVLIRNISHPFLVGLHYSFQTNDKLYFVLDYINGGELFFHLQREKTFGEPRACFYAAEIASALGYMHSLNIVYRDLKPENILINRDGHVVLTDFGLCKEGIAAKASMITFCGTPEYLAPEIIEKKPYAQTVDWWCLGAVLYEMLFGLPPFYSRNKTELYQNILTKPLEFRPNSLVTPHAKDVMTKLLEKNKDHRLGARNDFSDIKHHPFFAAINWTMLEQKALSPPFVPHLTGDMDLKHFDHEFISEPLPASIERTDKYVDVNRRFIKSPNDMFYGFSYAKPEKEQF